MNSAEDLKLPRCSAGRRIAGVCQAISFLFLGVTTTVGQTPLPPTLPNPRLSYIFPAGGQAGQTLDVTVGGDDLDDVRFLRFNNPGISATPKLTDPGLGQIGPQPIPGTFLVTIAPDVAADVYELRVEGKYGLSTPRAFVVGTAPEIRESEPNNTLKDANPVPLGAVINGNTDGAALDYFKFTATKGQRVIIDCQAYRIDSRLDGTLILFNSAGRELDRSHNVNRRDPMIDYSIAEDGEYFVALHDHVYGYYTMPGESFYRLSISTAPYLDFLFPPAGMAGSRNKYTLYGRNLPGGQPAPGVEAGGRPLEMLSVEIELPADRSKDLSRNGGLHVEPSESFLDGVSYRLPSSFGLSNPLLLTVASAPIVAEQEPNDDPAKAMLLDWPCEHIGQFYPRGDRDWVSFRASKGDVLSIEVISQRLGLATDPRLVVQQVKREGDVEQAIDLQTSDDDLRNADRVHWSFLDSLLFNVATHDPSIRFVAPDEGLYRIMVTDTSRPSQDVSRTTRGHHRNVYRLAIRPPQPDFRLVAVPRPPTNAPQEASSHATVWAPLIRSGGADLIEVFAERRDGFDGEIEIRAENLPAGVTALPVTMAARQTSTTLVLQGAANLSEGSSPITITGKARLGTGPEIPEVVRVARPATMVWAVQLTGVTHHRSRLSDQLLIATRSDPAPFRLIAGPGQNFETSLLGTIKLPIAIERSDTFRGGVELFAYGLPPTIHGPLHAQPKFHTPLNIKADQNSCEMEIKVPNHVPTGTYSFFVSGVGTVPYARNPEKLQMAEQRLASAEKVLAESETSLKAAVMAQQSAGKLLSDAQSAQQDLKSPTEAKAAADKAVAEADTRLKQQMAALTLLRQEVGTLREKCKPTEIKLSVPSNPVNLKITSAPFELSIPSNTVPLRQGQRTELPVTVKRLYGSTDPIQVQLLAVYSTGGLSCPPVTIPADQNHGTLIVEASPSSPVGARNTQIQATVTVQGQQLSVRQDVNLIIEKPTP